MDGPGGLGTRAQSGGGLFGLRDLLFFDVLSRWPLLIARFEWLKIRQMFRSARGPAQVMIWTNFCWIVPIMLYNQYAQVYALELGIDKPGLGYLTAVGLVTQVVFYLVGGWLTDRLGNLRCVLLFDTISWPLPMAVLAGATEPWHFYVAAVLAGTMTAVVPGWHAVFVSRVPVDRRAAAYGLHSILSNLPGLFLPLVGGWLVGLFGLELSMRCLYIAAAVLMTAGTALRWAIIPPTPPTAGRMAGAFETLGEQFGSLWRVLKRRDMRRFLLATTLINLDVAMTGVFLPVYFMEYLGISKQDYALVPTVGCAVRLAVMFLVVPFIRPRNTRGFLAATGAVWLVGTAMLLLCLNGATPPAFLARILGYSPGAAPRAYLLSVMLAVYGIWAVGGAFYGPASMARWMNTIPEEVRSRLWGAFGASGQVLAALLAAGVGNLFALWCPAVLIVEMVLEASALVLFCLIPAQDPGALPDPAGGATAATASSTVP